MALQFGRKEARQLAVLTQLLDAIRPTDVVDRVDRLTLLQIDPTAAIARSAELVPWGRLGPHTSPPISLGRVRSGRSSNQEVSEACRKGCQHDDVKRGH
jgi:uncharacterized protein YcaQ